MARIALPVGLLIAASALLVATSATAGSFSLTPGPPILLAGALAAALIPGRVGALIGLIAAGIVLVASVGPATAGQLAGANGSAVAAARWLEVAALALAVGTAAVRLVGRPAGAEAGRGAVGFQWADLGQVAGVVVLSAIGAELLSAYGDSTGDPAAVAFAIVFFSALYGAPALLARELVRRRGWGWPSMLLLFGALGVAQACLIDQAMFSADYGGYEGWEETRNLTLVPALGISGYNAFNFVVGHVIFSFAAPFALAEAWRPERAHRPWLGPAGVVLAALGYLAAAFLVWSDPGSRSASPVQLAVSTAVIAALVLSAGLVGRRTVRPAAAREAASAGLLRLPIPAVLASSLGLAMLAGFAPESWFGLAIGVAATAATAVGLWLASRRTEWTIHHIAAVALAWLLVRGSLAFTYFPLLGEVAAGPKYAHNVVMMLLMLAAGWLALRRPG